MVTVASCSGAPFKAAIVTPNGEIDTAYSESSVMLPSFTSVKAVE
jgi:hypothetical protein